MFHLSSTGIAVKRLNPLFLDLYCILRLKLFDILLISPHVIPAILQINIVTALLFKPSDACIIDTSISCNNSK